MVGMITNISDRKDTEFLSYNNTLSVGFGDKDDDDREGDDNWDDDWSWDNEDKKKWP